MALDYQDSGLYDPIQLGPQNDGTYDYPLAAQPYNMPSNTAGYSSATPSWVGDVLSKGIGAVGSYFNNAQILDYRRFEATNGGLYAQGFPALLARNGAGGMNPVLLIAIIGGIYLLARR